MDTLRLYLVTWNVACKQPEECLNELLGFSDSNQVLPDIYVIGLQEVKAQIQNIVIDSLFDDPWTNAFRSKLEDKNYVKVKTSRLQGIVLTIYILRKHILQIRDIETQVVRTGLGGLWGNKGCVSIRMTISGVSVCFVNSHLAPHDHNLPTRISDYNAIVKELIFNKQKETSLIFYHDYVFWLGDHNFRIDENVSQEEVLNRISKNELNWLIERDQLKSVMKSGEAFSELTEPAISFPPTFKFIFNTSNYDSKRRPAWTDRILYKVTENAYENLKLSVKPQNYTSFPQYTQSDHKPVVSPMLFKVFSHHVDRIVEFAHVNNNTWFIDQENCIAVIPADDVKVSDWDWIGIYKANFSSLDDYLSFMYINPRPSIHETGEESPRRSTPTGRIVIRFPDNMIRNPGNYCLLYMSQDSSSVLGMSAIFTAEFSKSGSTNNPGLFGGPLRLSPLADAARNMSPRRTPSTSPQLSPIPGHKMRDSSPLQMSPKENFM